MVAADPLSSDGQTVDRIIQSLRGQAQWWWENVTEHAAAVAAGSSADRGTIFGAKVVQSEALASCNRGAKHEILSRGPQS